MFLLFAFLSYQHTVDYKYNLPIEFFVAVMFGLTVFSIVLQKRQYYQS